MPPLELLGTFDHVAMALGRGVHVRPTRWSIKVWSGGSAESCPPFHYEAQVLSARHVPGARTLGLEIGFHAEARDEAVNAAALDALLAAEKSWRKALGRDPVAGAFLGRATKWRRVSETWADPDLSDPDVVIEIADRLATYVAAIDPVLRRATSHDPQPASAARPSQSPGRAARTSSAGR